MSGPVRQSNLFAAEDFLKIYRSFRDVDFTAYDFDTIRTSLVEYIKEQYPEDFNDYIESSEYIALIELLAYLGTSLALRTDLNSRENFLDTAERRESIIRLARMLSYNPKRRIPGKGLFKITGVSTSEPITDSLGRNLKDSVIFWDDANNEDSFEQFITVMNAAFNPSNPFGKPSKSGTISGISTDLYELNSNLPISPIQTVTFNLPNGSQRWDVVNPDFTDGETFFERHPDPNKAFNVIYRNDGSGLGSPNTGFFLYLKQGSLVNRDFRIDFPIKNRVINVSGLTGVNQEDVYFQEIDDDGDVVKEWVRVPALVGNNVVFNSLELDQRDIFNVISQFDDAISLKFADGNFGNVPRGVYRLWARQSVNESYTLRPENASNLRAIFNYVGKNGQPYNITVFYQLVESISNAVPSETDEQIKLNAPAVFYTQNRMVNSEDYNVFPLSRGNEVEKVRAINRTHAGHSRFIDINDPTGMIQNVKVFAEDGAIYKDYEPERLEVDITDTTNLETVIIESLFPFLRNQRLNNFFYDNYYKEYIADNPNDLDFLSEDYFWGTLPQKDKGSTGFLFTEDPLVWTYVTGSGEWENGATGFTPSEGILLDSTRRYTIEATSGITNDDYFVSANRIYFFSSYSPSNGDSLTITYRDPVNTDFNANRFIDAGAKAVFINPMFPDVTDTVTIRGVANSGLPGSLAVDSIGPVELSSSILDEWQLSYVLPRFRLEFTSTEIKLILTQMELQNDFGIGYSISDDAWYIIPSGKVDIGTTLDINNFDSSTRGNANDSSWLVYADYQAPTVSGGTGKYVFTTRGRRYVFESLREVRFFYSPEQRAIDVQTGREMEDEIWILDINTKMSDEFDETWTYDIGGDEWSTTYINTNGDSVTETFANSVGIPLREKDPITTIISSDPDRGIDSNFINNRGILETSSITWEDGDTVTVDYGRDGKLDRNIIWNIDRSFILEDGYLDQTKIEIKPRDEDEDGVPDYPLSFDDFVAPDDIIYFERYFDFDNYEYFRPWKTGYNTISVPTDFDFVNSEINGVSIDDTGLFIFANETDIRTFIGVVEDPDNYLADGETLGTTTEAERLLRQFNFARSIEGKIILNNDTNVFYDIPLYVPPDPPARPVIDHNFDNTEVDFDHYTRVGRSFTLNTLLDDDEMDPLWFKWKHFAPNINRIDPSVSNIIDMYILTSAYYAEVLLWRDEDGDPEVFPDPPTTEELRVQFGELAQYKMLSDQIIFNSATFKPLFGRQADPEYRATFKVVKLPSTFVSDSEIKSRVVAAVNEYFDIRNWDFGESFFYTELAAYIHQQLSTMIASVVIVPEKQESQFGDLFQIKAEPTELFLSVATVRDIEIVETLTDANLRLK